MAQIGYTQVLENINNSIKKKDLTSKFKKPDGTYEELYINDTIEFIDTESRAKQKKVAVVTTITPLFTTVRCANYSDTLQNIDLMSGRYAVKKSKKIDTAV